METYGGAREWRGALHCSIALLEHLHVPQRRLKNESTREREKNRARATQSDAAQIIDD